MACKGHVRGIYTVYFNFHYLCNFYFILPIYFPALHLHLIPTAYLLAPPRTSPNLVVPVGAVWRPAPLPSCCPAAACAQPPPKLQSVLREASASSGGGTTSCCARRGPLSWSACCRRRRQAAPIPTVAAVAAQQPPVQLVAPVIELAVQKVAAVAAPVAAMVAAAITAGEVAAPHGIQRWASRVPVACNGVGAVFHLDLLVACREQALH